MRCLKSGLLAAATVFIFARDSTGQAWTPLRGDGSISVSYQRIANTGHRLTDGSLIGAGRSVDMGLYLEAEYAATDRLSFAAGMPYVFAKYTDPNPGPPPIPYLPWEQCHCWQTGWQDFGFTARYNVTGGAFGLTPSISIGVPSHEYQFRGESALGRNLKELRIAVDAGQRLDAISKNLSVQGRYSYAFVEQVLGVPNNRSNINLELAYLVKKRVSVRGLMLWQRTHGGLRFGSMPPHEPIFPGEVNTPELLYEHDRLLRDNYWRTGASVAYSLASVDLFASYVAFVSGTDTHAGRAVTIGFSVPFHLGRR